MNLRAVSLVFGTAALTCSALAGPIPVQNFSFELPDLGHDTFASERVAAGAPPGWFSTGSGGTGIGVADPSGTNYTGTDGPVLPGTADGAQYGFLNLPAGFSNNWLYTGFSLGNFVAGETYTLTVAVGGRKDGGLPPNLYQITMLSGGLPVGTGASAPGVADTFFDLSYAFTATGAENGQPIGIQLSASNTSGAFEQANIDNVRLSVLVPEPASTALLALLGAGAAARRRRSPAAPR